MKTRFNTPAGWAWLLFAAINVIVACTNDLPKLVAGLLLAPHWGLLFPVLGVLGVIGLCQYAVGWRSPRIVRFWRLAAPVVVIAFTIMIARGFPATARLLVLLQDAPLQMIGLFFALALVIGPAAMIALALLRLGDYLGPTRRPLGQKPAQLSLSFS
jgi:hypothetical protein